MKKFLTVLLALSVVFTYTVGTAFAAMSTPSGSKDAATEEEVKLLNDAYDYAQRQVNAYFDDAYKAVVEAGEIDTYKVEKDAWDALTIKADLAKILADQADAYAKHFDFTVTATTTYKDLAQAMYTDGDIALVGSNIDTEANLVAWIHATYDVDAALNQYDTDIAEVVDWLNNVDYSIYSTKVPEEKSYYELAYERVEGAKLIIKKLVDASYSSDKLSNLGPNEINLLNNSVAGFKTEVKKYVKEIQIEDLNGNLVGTGKYKVVPGEEEILTNEQLEDNDLTDAALAAKVKAAAQAAYAEFIKNNKSADKAVANAWLKVAYYLADAGKIDDANITGLNYYYTAGNEKAASNLKLAVSNVEDLTAFANKFKAETDANGVPVRDAKKVDEYVDEYTEAAYLAAWNLNDIPSTYETETKIVNSAIAKDAAKFAFDKEVAVAKLEKAKADAADKYYPVELSKVEAAYDTAIAKVKAATTDADYRKINLALQSDLFGIKDMGQVKTLFEKAPMSTELTNQIGAIENYVKNVLNYGKTVLDPTYVVMPTDLGKVLKEFFGENGARTVAEMKALAADTKALADKFPTKGAIRDGKTAVEEAIDAIPAKVTSSDRATVEAAWNALVDYAEFLDVETDATGVKNYNDLTAAITSLYGAISYDLAVKVNAVDKTDKVALKELQAEFDALNDLTDEGKLFDGKHFNDEKIVAALKAIREAEAKAVIDAIKALPVNVTLENKAQVEAARALYDAYVAEYTDPTFEDENGNIIGDYAAGNITNLRGLTLAEARIAILQAKADIKAVESLKIKASSSAVKGKITVKWTVKGDVPAGTVYKVYKSTKAQSGYAYMGKTTKNYMANKKNLKKGKRYFYKVKAVLVVDGQTYTSDWSNKANRFAK